MKLKDLIERFVIEMNGTETLAGIKPLMPSHSYCLKRLQRTLIAQKDAPALTKFDVIEHVKERRKTVCAATALHDIVFLRGVLKYAGSAWDDCSNVSDACIAAAMPMLNKHGLVGKSMPRKIRPTEDQLDSLIAYFTPQDASPRTKIKMIPVVLFGLVSTRRRGEVCRITHGDVEWDRKDRDGNHAPVYWVRDMKHPTSKLGNHKSFVLVPELAAIIKAQPRLTNDPNERIFPYNDKSVGARYTLAKKALGIKNLRLHDNRREAISRWLALLPPHEVRIGFSGHNNTIILEKHYDARDPGTLFGKIQNLVAKLQVTAPATPQ